jgi:predicted RecB family nuclease
MDKNDESNLRFRDHDQAQEQRQLEVQLARAEKDLAIARAVNAQKKEESTGHAAFTRELLTVYRFSMFIAVIAVLTFFGIIIGLIVSLKFTQGNTKTAMTIVLTVLSLLSLLGVIAAVWRSMDANKRLVQASS